MKLERSPRYGAILACLTAGVLLSVSDAVPADPQTKTHTVTIEALKYSPPTLEVKSGDTIVWRNKDPFPHTVTAENRSFDSGEIAADHSWKFTARQPGTYPYVCTLHPTMKGSLVVK
jgi:plastocyanin